jgi:hypothetical protein
VRTLLTLAFTLALAAPAWAGDNGEGVVGEADDKIVTFASLGVLLFFVAIVVVFSAIQGRLEKRHQQRKAVELRRRIGW